MDPQSPLLSVADAHSTGLARRPRVRRGPADAASAQASAPLQALLDVLAGRVDDAPRPLDEAGWTAFVAEAARHGVSALAYRELARGATVPTHVLRSLEGQYLRNRLRNLRLYAHLGPLLDALDAESIEAIVLKGAFLAQAVYAEPALRAMADADLLVRERDLARAARAMRSLGWRAGAALAASGHQLPTFELDGVQVELHWTIEDDAAPFAVDVAGLWERAAPTPVGRSRALALSPEDLLLHLCLHTAYGHGWKQFDGGLRQLADIVAVVRRHGSALDWHGLAARADAWRVGRCVGLCLATARDLLGAEVPTTLPGPLAPAHGRWMPLARELALGSHYRELAHRLPVLSRPWVDKRWHRLSRTARWREQALPAPASLARAYPALGSFAPLLRLAHWNDLAGDVLHVALDAGCRRLVARERERRALIAWLEGSA